MVNKDGVDFGAVDAACRQLMMRYAASMDLKDIDGMVEVFASNLLWERPGMAPMRTHADIREFFRHFWMQRHAENADWFDVHLLTTCSIVVNSSDEATGHTWCVMYSAPGHKGPAPAVMPERPELIVLYRDRFHRFDVGWRIVEHKAEHLFRSPVYRPPEVPVSLAKEMVP